MPSTGHQNCLDKSLKYGVPPSLLPLQFPLSGGDTEHFMAVQTLFPKGAILDIRDASKVNYFAPDKGRSLTCRVFIKADMVLFCLYKKFHIIYFQIFFYTVV